MEIPTAELIREWSNVGFAEFGYPEPPSGTDRLDRKIAESAAELQMLLGESGITLVFADVVADSGEELLVQRAVQMLTEYNVVASQQEKVDTASDFDLVQSVSVGPISETRRTLSANANVLHPWPALNKLLHGLMSLLRGGTLEGIDPRIPVIQSVENRTDVQYPGTDVIYAQRWLTSIFGDLRGYGVWRAGDLTPGGHYY